MLAGFLAALSWVLFFKEGFYGLYEMIPGFVTGFPVTVVVSLFTQPPQGAEQEHEVIWKAIGSSRPEAARVTEV